MSYVFVAGSLRGRLYRLAFKRFVSFVLRPGSLHDALQIVSSLHRPLIPKPVRQGFSTHPKPHLPASLSALLDAAPSELTESPLDRRRGFTTPSPFGGEEEIEALFGERRGIRIGEYE